MSGKKDPATAMLKAVAQFFEDRTNRAVMLDTMAEISRHKECCYHTREAMEWTDAFKGTLTEAQQKEFEKICPKGRDIPNEELTALPASYYEPRDGQIREEARAYIEQTLRDYNRVVPQKGIDVWGPDFADLPPLTLEDLESEQ
ncbi:hypothetical protein ACIGGE_10550 [Qipengyuania sp. NPDC077410]|uniref:hypothetical protein n=1 Tax=Qipengyuania sp. NPDC077410 TaxID=3364496 RepID=UPI0037C542BF